jgi:hypothetical protein
MNEQSLIKRILTGAFNVLLSAFAEASEEGDSPRVRKVYPRFSWETVPLYQMFGHDTRLLTDAEVRKIAASSDFICIEKQHGHNTLGGAELGAHHEAKRFKTVKPGITVLFYWNASVAYPFTSFTREFTVPTGPFAQLAGGQKLSDRRRPWLVVDPKTGALATRDGHVYYFDVLNPNFRKWWSDTVGQVVREGDCAGFFLDQLHSAFWLRPKQHDEIRRSMKEMMIMAKKAMGPDTLLLANNGAHEYLDCADAFMFEHYNEESLSKEAIVQDWALMKKVAEAGKISVYRMQPDLKGTPFENATRKEKYDVQHHEIGKVSKELLEFPLACFLIGAQPYSYFCYNWGWGLTTGPLVDYPEFKKPLGAPKGECVRRSPTEWVFTREFEHASVLVDLEKRTATINWHK